MTNKLKRIFPLIIALCVSAAYCNSLNGVFIFDDMHVIVNNPGISTVWPIPVNARILVDLTFRLNYLAGGLNPAGYHLVNIIIHITSALLLFGIIRRTFLVSRMTERSPVDPDLIALFSALIWAVHPLQTQSVTYLCQRYESMMGLFYLLSIYCFVKGVACGKINRPWLWAGFISCLLGMGTKEVIVTLPVFLVFYDYVFISDGWSELFQKRKAFHVSLFLTWPVLALLWIWSAVTRPDTGMVMLDSATPLSFLLTQMEVIPYYVRLAVIPHPLCLDYCWPVVEHWSEVVLPGLLVLTTGAWSVYGLLTRRSAGFLSFTFFLLLAPTSSIMPSLDAAFEHRMYLSLAPLTILMVTGIFSVASSQRFGGGSRNCRLAGWVLTLFVAVSVILTYQRNSDYSSELQMWQNVAKQRDANIRARHAIGTALLKQGRAEDATRVFYEILSLYDVNSSITTLERTVFMRTMLNLGAVLYGEGKYADAEREFRRALHLVPSNIDGINNLGLALKMQGKTSAAVDEWRKALYIMPNPTSFLCLGSTYYNQGHYRKALDCYEKAILLNPGLHDAVLNTAWLLASCRDADVYNPEKARSLVLSVMGKKTDPGLVIKSLDTLSVAEAAIGNFGKAVDLSEKALKVGKEQGLAGLESIELRLTLYRNHKPFCLENKTAPQ